MCKWSDITLTVVPIQVLFLEPVVYKPEGKKYFTLKLYFFCDPIGSV